MLISPLDDLAIDRDFAQIGLQAAPLNCQLQLCTGLKALYFTGPRTAVVPQFCMGAIAVED